MKKFPEIDTSGVKQAIGSNSLHRFIEKVRDIEPLQRLNWYRGGFDQQVYEREHFAEVNLWSLLKAVGQVNEALSRGNENGDQAKLLSILGKEGAHQILIPLVQLAKDIHKNNPIWNCSLDMFFEELRLLDALKAGIMNDHPKVLKCLEYFEWNYNKKIYLLHYAIENKKPESVRAMMSLLSDSINELNYTELLNNAIKEHDHPVLDALLDIRTLSRLSHHVNPLIMLAKSDRDYSLYIDKLAAHFDCNRVDEVGNTPLHYAIQSGNCNTVRKLALRTNLNIKGQNHRKPFELAIFQYLEFVKNENYDQTRAHELLEIINLLATAGADVNTCPSVATQNPELHDLLYRLGANIEAPKQRLSREISDDQSDDDQLPEWIAIKGGGMKGLAYMGAFEEAQYQGLIDLEKTRGFIGTSAGAITALLLALRVPLPTLRKKMEAMDFTTFLDFRDPSAFSSLMHQVQQGEELWKILIKNNFSLFKMKSALDEHLGACEGNAVLNWLHMQIKEAVAGTSLALKSPELITFQDLKNHPDFAELVVYGSNMSTGRSERYCFETTPDMPIADAVRISMSLPIIFKPHRKYIVINGKRVLDPNDTSLCVDGGLFCNYPIKDLDHNNKTGSYKRNRKIMGFCLVSDDEHKEYEHRKSPKSNDHSENGIISFITNMITASMFNVQEQDNINGLDRDRTIYINTRDVGTTEFFLTSDRREMLYEEGREGVRNFKRRRLVLPENKISDYLQKRLFATGMLKQDGVKREGGDKELTPARIFKLFARARDCELDFLRTLVNPNWCDKNGVTALHIAREFGYKEVESRLLRWNANNSPRFASPEHIRESIGAKDIIRQANGNPALMQLSKKDRAEQRIRELEAQLAALSNLSNQDSKIDQANCN